MARSRSPRGRAPAAAGSEDSVEVTTLREGDGKTFPKEGDTIVLHYAGKLATADEKEPSFDSTYSRGKPFSCRIGVGEVIRGWDEAIPRMSLGQKVALKVKSEYAFGKLGAGAVPPDSDLKYEVELLRIN